MDEETKLEEPSKQSSKLVSVISNILLLVGLCFLAYYVFYVSPKQKARTHDTFTTVSNLAESIRIYKSEPETVNVLASEIQRNINEHLKQLKKEDYNPNVR
jgi:flagellar basal body-associated protein FliL